ncbi:FtsK/SpoIIIE domain-containing protein [Thiomicrorhabdus indica]|uniref:FtsK/SpoIIIE domain-containing protein n=1 Tax=Thiomicrorhabdus indica TaxID=2267253 RepID=UPI0013EE8C52|nr:FtsK/SpoIIIE domain-containing protein [Thiomicrorhabdus indica]
MFEFDAPVTTLGNPLKEVLSSSNLEQSEFSLPVVIGRERTGENYSYDLVQIHSLLIAGKSAPENDVFKLALLSLLKGSSVSNLRMVLIDAKRKTLTEFDQVPHLLTPVITRPDHAMNALNWCLNEAFKRRQVMDALKVRDIEAYNRKVIAENADLQPLPYIVMGVRELAELSPDLRDLMISQTARISRATGIHLIVATKWLSEEVITEKLKAYMPSRIVLQTASPQASKFIFDVDDVEKVGWENLLFLPSGKMKPLELLPTSVMSTEVIEVLNSIQIEGKSPDYVPAVIAPPPEPQPYYQEMTSYFESVVEFIFAHKQVSFIMLQRELRTGFNKTHRILDQMQEVGVVIAEPSENETYYRLNGGC